MKPNALQQQEPNANELNQLGCSGDQIMEEESTKISGAKASGPAASTTSNSVNKAAWLKSVVAFDGMLIPFSCLPCLPALGPVVAQVLYKEEGT
jgi:hypothetical protein